MPKLQFWLTSQRIRENAVKAIMEARDGSIATVDDPKRSDRQNRKMWAMLRDITNAMPEGRRMIPDEWKAVMMQACGWEVKFLEGLDGRPFPAGFRSSHMTVKQMADLITFIQQKGDEWSVPWKEAAPYMTEAPED